MICILLRGSSPDSAEMVITAFVQHTAHWRVLIDLLGLSMFAGLYSVPMYALIQMRTEKTRYRSNDRRQ